ncbi:MAG: hypothetical protein AAB116_07380 [Candidatus Poribacteria bacterium]
MPILIDTSLPDELAHKANSEATRADDARKSREAFEKKLREEQKKFINASQRRILLFTMLTAGFPFLLVWEWLVSQEIYEVFSPSAIWVPFVVCVVVATFTSACLGENSSLFLLTGRTVDPYDDEQNIDDTIRKMYIQKRKRNWLLSPAFGSILGFIFLVGIYVVSRMRVELMQKAGDISGTTANFHVYIPPILFFMEIIFGIPVFLFILWICNWVNIRNLGKRFAQERDQEIILSQATISEYEEYVAQLGEYNSSQELDGRPPRPPIPPNRILRRLLTESGHYDMADMEEQPVQRPRTPSDHIPNDRVDPTATEATSAGQDNIPPEDDEDSRIDDLINQMDDRISDQNRGI